MTRKTPPPPTPDELSQKQEEFEHKRFWVSWYWSASSRNYPNADFQFWVTGYGAGSITLCAVIDAEDEEAVWKRVRRYFRKMEDRFIEERELDWQPNVGRFPGFENKT